MTPGPESCTPMAVSHTVVGRARMLLAAVLVLAALPRVASSCYLLDAAAKCAVCWKTTYGSDQDSTGVTKMSECPEGIAETWKTAPPDTMYGGQDYPIVYELQLDQAKFGQFRQVN
jgi:hypothetical protein